MNITNVSSTAGTGSASVKAAAAITEAGGKTESGLKAAKTQEESQTAAGTEKKTLNEKDLQEITDGLNDFMQAINTDIRFELHTKTNTLMVRVEDIRTHKVIKECPPHELLDTIARIRECMGVFLDKKA